jgi:hypothetical protein
MSLRDVVRRLKTTPEELERVRLSEQCTILGATPIDAVEARLPVEIVGEVRSVRIVPRAGAPSLEVTIDDGHGFAVGVFFGRNRLAGVGPGRNVRFSGRALREHGRVTMYNPVYEFVS